MKVPLVALLIAACTSGPGGGDDTPDAGSSRKVAFYEDVAPILATHCLRCHVEGGISFPLISYDDVADRAEGVMLAVAGRQMPPYLVDSSGECQEYKDVTRLSDGEIATVLSWVQGERRKGDPAKAPPLPQPLPALAGETMAMNTGFDYSPDPLLDDDYRCFVLDAPLTEDKFLTGFEFTPGDKRVVHHAILFSMASAEAEAKAVQLDAADPKPGYVCFGGTRTGSDNVLAGWAPGTPATSYPEGTGIRVRAGRKMVLQVHYNLINGSHPDRSTMKLRFTDQVAKEAFTLPLANTALRLAPGMADVSSSYELEVPSVIGPSLAWAVYPHMHTLGKTLKVEVLRGGTATCLSSIPRWSFSWQRFYEYKTPIEVHGGDKVRLTCTYDTSHRTTTVTWGEGTEDEMCLALFYLTSK